MTPLDKILPQEKIFTASDGIDMIGDMISFADIKVKEERQRIKDEINPKLNLIKSLIDDLKEKVSYHVNISEHTGNIRDLLYKIEALLEEKK